MKACLVLTLSPMLLFYILNPPCFLYLLSQIPPQNPCILHIILWITLCYTFSYQITLPLSPFLYQARSCLFSSALPTIQTSILHEQPTVPKYLGPGLCKDMTLLGSLRRAWQDEKHASASVSKSSTEDTIDSKSFLLLLQAHEHLRLRKIMNMQNKTQLDETHPEKRIHTSHLLEPDTGRMVGYKYFKKIV